MTDVYLTFTGSINQDNIRKIVSSLPSTGLYNGKPFNTVHFMMHSTGGYVDDGIFLYNFFKSFPQDLIIYNGGGIHSIASIAFLGVKKRRASQHARFGIHRSRSSLGGQASELAITLQHLKIDDARTENILRQHLSLTQHEWTALDTQDVIFDAQHAKRAGFIDAIAEFAPPFGTSTYTI